MGLASRHTPEWEEAKASKDAQGTCSSILAQTRKMQLPWHV